MRVVQWRQSLLVLISLAALVALSFASRVPQDPAYHQFADARPLAGLANFWNVISNLPFIAADFSGYGGFRGLSMRRHASRPSYSAWP